MFRILAVASLALLPGFANAQNVAASLSTEPDASVTLSVQNNSSVPITAMTLHFQQWSNNPARSKPMDSLIYYDSLLKPSQPPIPPLETFRYHYGGFGHRAAGEVVAVLFADGTYWGSLDGIRRIKSTRGYFSSARPV